MTWKQGCERLAAILGVPVPVAICWFEEAADELERDQEPYTTEEVIEVALEMQGAFA